MTITFAPKQEIPTPILPSKAEVIEVMLSFVERNTFCCIYRLDITTPHARMILSV